MGATDLYSLCCASLSLLFLIGRSRLVAQGLGTRNAAPGLPAPPAERSPPPTAAGRRLQMMGGVIIVCAQLMALALRSDLRLLQEPAAALRPLAVLAVMGGLLIATPLAAPAAFERYRLLLVSAARVTPFMLTDFRDPRGISNVFTGQPATLASDLWHLVLGTRVVAMGCTAVACPLPLGLHLLLALWSFQRCRVADFVCSTPFLQHPVFRGRIAWLHAVMRKLPLLTSAQEALPSSAQLQQAKDCQVMVTFLQLLGGVVAPTLALAQALAPLHRPAEGNIVAAGGLGAAGEAGAANARHRRRRRRRRRHDPDAPGTSRAAAAEAEAEAETEAEDAAAEAPAADQPAIPAAPCKRQLVPGKLCRLARAAVHEVEASVHHLCALLAGAGGPVLAAASWYLLLCLLWLAALLLDDVGAGGAPAAPGLVAAA